MIRSIRPDDTTALLALLTVTQLFQSQEIEELTYMLKEYFAGESTSEEFWFTDDDGELVSVAYVAPERMTVGNWNLYLIAVHPQYQRQGRGTCLLRHVEQTLAARGERLLLIETSGLDSFQGTQAFYKKNGYEEEARIRDFYQAGEDKIIFRKTL